MLLVGGNEWMVKASQVAYKSNFSFPTTVEIEIEVGRKSDSKDYKTKLFPGIGIGVSISVRWSISVLLIRAGN